jgi:hypothetical protein
VAINARIAETIKISPISNIIASLVGRPTKWAFRLTKKFTINPIISTIFSEYRISFLVFIGYD